MSTHNAKFAAPPLDVGFAHQGNDENWMQGLDSEVRAFVCAETRAFDVSVMRQLMDGHNLQERDFMYDFMARSELFQLKKIGDSVFVFPDVNEPMEAQREKTLQRIIYLRDSGIFKDWMKQSPELDLRRAAMFESLSIFDHSLAIKLGVHVHLWSVGSYLMNWPVVARCYNT